MVTLTPFHSVLDRMLALSRAMDGTSESAEPTIPGWASTGRGQIWFPPVDTYETQDAFVLEMDLPGVHAENVDISFEQNTLTIKGERGATLKSTEKGELRVFASERVSGQFARAIRLPDYVDGEKIEANYVNGVLTIRIPKSVAARPRKIAIGSGNAV